MAKEYFPAIGILTKDTLSSGERRIPIRPLGPLSDLVVDSLPTALVSARGGNLTQSRGLLDRVEEYAGDLQVRGLPGEGTLEHKVGRLDVLMLYAGFAHIGLRIHSNLSNLLREFSKTQIPALTYEDIVLNNPQKDTRTFTDQEVGADEEHFYGIHQDLEHAIKPAVIALKKALVFHLGEDGRYQYGFKKSYPEKAKELVVEADKGATTLSLLVNNTRTVGSRMRYFDEFRPFLNPIPQELLAPTLPQVEYVGPSGAYSGSVHALDLLIEGSIRALSLDDEVIKYIGDKRVYIPQVDYPLLDTAVAFSMREKKLKFVSDQPNPLLETLIGFGGQLLMFRWIHLGAVSRQVPEVLRNSNEIGTGGINNVAAFLHRRIERIEKTLRDLREMGSKRELSSMVTW